MRRIQKLIATVTLLISPLCIVANVLDVNDEFVADGITYKVIRVSPNEVQVGKDLEPYQYNTAISKSTTGSVNIPSTVKGTDGNSYTVTSIGHCAFYDCNKITSVSIPSTVKSIGTSAFVYNARLEEIRLPDNLEHIGGEAFKQCFEIKTMTIPASVKTIGNGAFRWSGIKDFIVKSRTPIAISKEVFRDWTDGEVANGSWPAFISERAALYVPKGCLNAYQQAEGWQDFWAIVEEGTELLKLGDQFTVGSLTYKVTDTRPRVEVAKSDNNKTLTGTLEIPAIVNGSDGFEYTVTDFAAGAFEDCKGLTSVILPNTIKQIGLRSFVGCSGLTSISIPESVTSIGISAFSGCSSLTSLFIPKSVKSISKGAFEYCI